jgi:S-adenosylmethionine decarboxylase
MNQIIGLGTHIIANLLGCPKELLEEVPTVRRILNEIVEEANLNKIGEVFHQFKPHGVTGIILLAESHISIHTWPESNTAAIDIFTCGEEGNAEKAFELALKKFKPQKYERKKVQR